MRTLGFHKAMFDRVLPQIRDNWHIYTLWRYFESAQRKLQRLEEDDYAIIRVLWDADATAIQENSAGAYEDLNFLKQNRREIADCVL